MKYVVKSIQYLRKNGIINFIKLIYKKMLLEKIENQKYQRWILKHIPDKEKLEKQKLEDFECSPLFSIVVPLYNTPIIFLRELIASVEQQSYSNWELILSNGSEESLSLESELMRYKRNKKYIVINNHCKLDIATNTNCAIKKAKGDYLVFIDHDDILTPNALYECTKAINEFHEPDIIYSDEDKVSMDGRTYFQPHFKPDYNSHLLRSMNYFCHLVVVKRGLQEKVGLLNPQYNGAQDYDFVLRCVEKTEKICHIPKILYHWRAHKGSVAGNGECKEYAFEAGRQALLAQYKRCGINAEVKIGKKYGIYHTHYIANILYKVSIIVIYEGNKNELDECLLSIKEKTNYVNCEIIILDAMQKNITYNSVTENLKSDLYIFLSSKARIISPEWIDCFCGIMTCENVGIVGVHLYQKNMKQYYTGMYIERSGAINVIGYKEKRDEAGYFAKNFCLQEFSVVDKACIGIRKECLCEIGHLDSKISTAYANFELCLKARMKGYLIVYNPDIKLIYTGRKSRKEEKIVKSYLQKNWKSFLSQGDPYYNPNLQKEI